MADKKLLGSFGDTADVGFVKSSGNENIAGIKTFTDGAVIKGSAALSTSAGNIGESWELYSGNPNLSITKINLISQAVTPGVYLVSAQAQILTGTASLSYVGISISKTSATFDGYSRIEVSSGFSNNPSWGIAARLFRFTGNETLYLVGEVTGTVGTGTWYSLGTRMTIVRIA